MRTVPSARESAVTAVLKGFPRLPAQPDRTGPGCPSRLPGPGTSAAAAAWGREARPQGGLCRPGGCEDTAGTASSRPPPGPRMRTQPRPPSRQAPPFRKAPRCRAPAPPLARGLFNGIPPRARPFRAPCGPEEGAVGRYCTAAAAPGYRVSGWGGEGRAAAAAAAQADVPRDPAASGGGAGWPCARCRGYCAGPVAGAAGAR